MKIVTSGLLIMVIINFGLNLVTIFVSPQYYCSLSEGLYRSWDCAAYMIGIYVCVKSLYGLYRFSTLTK